MSTRQRHPMLLTSFILLVMMVQVVVASPVCRCPAMAADQPCHAPVESQPKRCCEDPAPVQTCPSGMSIGCCGEVPAEIPETAAIPADAGCRLIEPVETEVAIAEPVIELRGLGISPHSKLEVLLGAPVYLRHAALLI